MNILQALIDRSGGLLFSIPAALIILLSREWYCARMTGEKEKDLLTDFSLLSFCGLSLNGIAPGGLLRENAAPVLRFVHGQLWLLLLLFVGVIYVMLKGPQPETFTARFFAAFVEQSWALLVINFIPLPPFDAATTYFSSLMQWRFFSLVVMLLSFASIVIFSYEFWKTDFLTGRFLSQWLRLI